MVIITKSALTLFGLEHPNVYQSLMDWYTVVKESDWRNFHDVKQTFNSVDSVGNDHYVFNIKGNKYRLIAMIFSINAQSLFDLWVHIENTMMSMRQSYSQNKIS